MAKRIYVGNLSYRTTEDQLKRLFAQAGRVEKVRIMSDRTIWPTIVAFVQMEDDDAKRAIAQFNGQELNGRSLDLRDVTDPCVWIPRKQSRVGPGGRKWI
jgi:cold-inducible RNA-binding protein